MGIHFQHKQAGCPLQVVGVGTKALAEAAQHNTFDLSTLGSWQAGKPVPFAFLANAFEAIAQVCGQQQLPTTFWPNISSSDQAITALKLADHASMRSLLTCTALHHVYQGLHKCNPAAGVKASAIAIGTRCLHMNVCWQGLSTAIRLLIFM